MTDAEKHSASTAGHQAWSGEEVQRTGGGSEVAIRMESSSSWSRRNPSDPSEELDKGSSGRKIPTVSHTGSWRRGMTAQVGVTSPRTKSSSSAGSTGPAGAKVHSSGTNLVAPDPLSSLPGAPTRPPCPAGKTDDIKVSEKGRRSPRANGLRRSPSDAGRSSGDEAKKQPVPSSSASSAASDTLPHTHGLASRTPTSTFGFKKPCPGMVAMVTASGATITSGSATLGKLPKSGGRSLTAGLKTGGLDSGAALAHHDDGFLPMSARSTLQYRSLPRPSRSGAAARTGNRSSTSSIEAAVLSVTSQAKSSLSVSKVNGSALLCNQTDREKGVADIDLRGGGAATVPLPGRTQVSSPTLRR